VLTEDDWRNLDEASAQNRYPLTGQVADFEYNALFARIVNAVSVPLGLEPAL
jgi:hypothetical protein